MATIEYVPDAISNQAPNNISNQRGRWSRVLHDAGIKVVDEQLALQLWKQQHRQGVFTASAKFGFTGMVSRLQSQRRGHW